MSRESAVPQASCARPSGTGRGVPIRDSQIGVVRRAGGKRMLSLPFKEGVRIGPYVGNPFEMWN